jgi:hypothetical protein
MHSDCSTNGKTKLPELAADSEKQNVFIDQYEDLYWIARLICGNPERAHIAVVDAGKISDTANPVFRDWLQKWARAATARAAIEGNLGTVLNAALAYSAPTGKPESLDPLSEVEFEFLHVLEMERVVERLDPFARSVLVLHGVLQQSISDCARLIGVPRDRVIAAYHRAYIWVKHQQRYGRELEGATANAGS